jgi:hypothetical protein
MMVPRQPLMKIGDGFDSITSELREKAINYTKIEDIEETEVGKIHTVQEIMQGVEDHETLMNFFGISLGASIIGKGLGGAIKMSRQTRFYKGKKYYAVYIKKVVGEKRLIQPLLVEASEDVLYGQGIERFHQIHGDCFVEGFQYGGELFAIMEVSAKEKQSLFHIELGLLNNLLGLLKNIFSIEASTAYDSEKILQNLQISLSIYQHGGNSQSQPRTIADLKDYVDRFLRDVETNPVAISAITRSYDTLADDYYVSLDTYIQPKKYAIELAGKKLLAWENYLAQLNQEDFKEQSLLSSLCSTNINDIHRSKIFVKEFISELQRWLEQAVSIGGIWDISTIPNRSIDDLPVKFYWLS